jgi:hypothetical protein
MEPSESLDVALYSCFCFGCCQLGRSRAQWKHETVALEFPGKMHPRLVPEDSRFILDDSDRYVVRAL